MLATNLGGDDVPAELRKNMPLGHASLGGKLLIEVAEGSRDADTGKIVIKQGGTLDW